MRTMLTLIALLMMLSVSALAQVTAVPQLMNFQGRLTRPDGTPVPNGAYSVRFSLHDAPSGGTAKWNQTINPVTVRNGTFAVLLSGFPANTFAGDLYLEIKIGSDAPLTPRQQLVSVAYAFKADSVKDGSITGSSIANGTITADDLAPNALTPLAWLLGGNSGTNPANHFLGTTDNQPLHFRVNNERVMRYEPAIFSNDVTTYTVPNIIGGYSGNSVPTGVVGATISGGGGYYSFGPRPNTVTDDFGAIGGGGDNEAGYASTVSGGITNKASGEHATVGGGFVNIAYGYSATVGGGNFNIAGNGSITTVGGGEDNTASGTGATIGGGSDNTAQGLYATIPGGQSNYTGGSHSFAAGRRAHANHHGAFVWGDSTDEDVASTGVNQFLIRANGGVKLYRNTTLEFGFGVSGKEVNAGKIGYSTFTANTLDIVGAGTTSGFRKVKVWAEGGTTFVGNINVNGTNYTSDSRYKTHIAPLENPMDTILNLRGVTFEWDRARWKERGFAEGRQIGFVAQEVEKVLPELVYTDTNGYKSVAYVNVVPVLVEAVKMLKKESDTKLKQKDAKIAELEAKLDALSEAVRQLQHERK